MVRTKKNARKVQGPPRVRKAARFGVIFGSKLAYGRSSLAARLPAGGREPSTTWGQPPSCCRARAAPAQGGVVPKKKLPRKQTNPARLGDKQRRGAQRAVAGPANQQGRKHRRRPGQVALQVSAVPFSFLLSLHCDTTGWAWVAGHIHLLLL